MSARRAAERMPALEGLRAVFAIGVVLLHVWMYTDADRHARTLTDMLISELRLGVVLFFALSGFLLWRPWLAAAMNGARRPDARRYALRRVFRVLPLYYLVGVVCFVLLGPDHPRVPDLAQTVSLVTLTQNYFDWDFYLIPPAWTLVVEAGFYVLIPFAGLAAVRLGARRWAQVTFTLGLVGAGVAYGLIWQHAGWARMWLATLPGCLFYFAAGMTAAALCHGRSVTRRTGWLLALSGAVLIALTGVWHARVGSPGQGVIRDLPAAAGFAMLIVAAGPAHALDVFAWRPLERLGHWSYGIYLWHYPLLMAARAWGVFPPGTWTATAALLAVCVPLAAFTYRYVEMPVMRFARRLER